MFHARGWKGERKSFRQRTKVNEKQLENEQHFEKEKRIKQRNDPGCSGCDDDMIPKKRKPRKIVLCFIPSVQRQNADADEERDRKEEMA